MRSLNLHNSDFSLLIASSTSRFNGKRTLQSTSVQPMLDYFGDKVNRIALLDQPVAYSDNFVPRMEIYERDVLTKQKPVLPIIFRPLCWVSRRRQERAGTIFRLKVRDLISVFYFALKEHRRYHLFIGLESINALCGIVLRKLGRVDSVVYYLFDYSPQRYRNKLINAIYLALDKFCAYHADYVWNVSDAMRQARLNLGWSSAAMAPQLVVPYGLYSHQIQYRPYEALDKHTLVFSGGLDEMNGTLLLVEAMPRILQHFPTTKLTITGSGPHESMLKERVRALGLDTSVKILGHLADHSQVEEILRRSYVGLAPYRDMPGSLKRLGDVIKLKLYMACGLPVITTHVPPLSKEIERRPAGIVVSDDVEELAGAVVKMFSDEAFHRRCRDNAVEMVKEHTWDNIFARALTQMELL